MWFNNTILRCSRELIPSLSDPCILETVFGKKNIKVISDEGQTLQQNLNILGFLLRKKSGGKHADMQTILLCNNILGIQDQAEPGIRWGYI